MDCIAENLKRIRRQRGMSQATLAQQAGVGQQLISQLESRKNTSTKKLPDLARALECAIHDLDPNYLQGEAADAPVMEKFSRIVSENDEDQLRLLEDYLDFLLSRQQEHSVSS